MGRDTILSEQPALAAKILGNLAKKLTRRLRQPFQHFRITRARFGRSELDAQSFFGDDRPGPRRAGSRCDRIHDGVVMVRVMME